jgi:hypothetical protein
VSDTLLPCAECGEDGIIVPLDGHNVRLYFVRVRRYTKCKRYKPGKSFNTCQTGLRATKAEAIDEWNREHGKDRK